MAPVAPPLATPLPGTYVPRYLCSLMSMFPDVPQWGMLTMLTSPRD